MLLKPIKKYQRVSRLTKLLYMLLNHKKLFVEKGIKFDLNYWQEHLDQDYVEPTVSKVKGKTVVCNTAACALGSAAMYTPFTKLGLGIRGYAPAYSGYNDFAAGAVFFGITEEESHFLFGPFKYTNQSEQGKFLKSWHDRYVTPLIKKYQPKPLTYEPTAKDVARRVRILLNHYKKTSIPLAA